MSSIWQRSIIALCACLLSLPGQALTRLTLGCPGTTQPENTAKGSADATWASYLMRDPSNYLGVEFRTARQVYRNERNPLATYVQTDRCYAVSYSKTDGYRSWVPQITPRGGIGEKRFSGPLNIINVGDPLANEINVGGYVFMFDAAGNLFDKQLRVVGVLLCHLNTDCTAY